MLNKIKNLQGVQKLTKFQKSKVLGGRIPTLKEFCCGPRSQGWWLQQYPFLGNDPYYTCGIDTCGNQ